MKRFFLVSALAIVFSVLIRVFIDSLLIYIGFLTLIVVLSLILVFKFKKKFLISLVCFVIISALMFLYTDGFIKSRSSLNDLIGTTQTFHCRIVDEPQFDGENYVYFVEPDSSQFEGINFSFKLKLNCKFNIGADAYDRLTACVDIKEFYDKTKLDFFAENVMLSGKIRYCSIEKVETKPYYYLIKKHILKAFPLEETNDLIGIPIAILTGDKTYISNGLYRDIKVTGMAHVMAVSGFHISVICMGIVMLMRKANVGRKLSAAIGLLILFTLSGVAGFTGSVLRAGLMYIIVFSGELLSRRPDAVNSLGFAITTLCILNPYSIFSISLLLSTMGTLGILLLSPPLTRQLIEKVRFRGAIRKIYGFVMGILIVSFSAGIFILPISLYTFGYVSTVSIIVNLFITIPVYVIIFSAILYVICFDIPFIGPLVLYICKASSYAFKYVIRIFADLDFAVFYSDDILLYVIIFSFGILCLLIYFFREKLMITFLLLAVAVCISISSLMVQNNIITNRIRLTFVPSDSGSLVIVESGGETAVISSSKDSSAIYNAYFCMYENLIDKIDQLIIASDDVSVLEKTIKLNDNFEVDKITLCKNDCDHKIGNVEIEAVNSEGEYDVLIYLNDENFMIDDNGTSSYKSDYILTRNPRVSYKINGNYSKYIIDGDREESIVYSGYINKNGGKTAILSDFGTITAEKINNNVLKFKR